MTDNSALRITPFHPQYLDGVSALIVSIQRGEYGIPITFKQQPDLHDIAGFYQCGAGQFWVALDNHSVIGTIALRDLGDGSAALRKMFVAAAYRGQRHGTAKALLETLLTHARRVEIRTIYLGTTEKFIAAHRFYEKHGFELVTSGCLPASFPRMKVDSRFYRITLSKPAQLSKN